MRIAVAAVVCLLAGCPSSQDPGLTGGDAGVDGAGSGEGCPPVPTCTTTIHYKGNATNVELRGDFASDGWTTGITMTKAGDGFDAVIPVRDNQIIVYKFVVDGNWIADPENARKSPDGYGAFNSVVRADCDACPARAPIDWRDAIMYFVMIDRFADGDPSNNAAVSGVEHPGNYQGG